jgi:hypothetical protein
MDLRKQLLVEQSKANCERIVNYVGSSEVRFADLVTLYLEGTYRVTQRAAWPISYCIEEHPGLIEPHLKKILDFAGKPNANVAVKRNTIRLLQFINIPEKYQGQVADLCFRFLADMKETIAVRVFSMTVLANLAREAPAISNEIKILIEDQLPYATAGFRSRARKVLKQLSSS